MGLRPGDGKPAEVPMPLCPWCLSFIEAGQDTAKVNGLNWHALCAEQREMDAMEDATLRENEA